MTDALLVFTTLPSADKAAELAKLVVEERLAACANLLPAIRSIYRWQGKLQDENEKIRVKLHSGLVRLTMRGWLGVLAAGGPKVIGWMAQKGLKGPGAVASALSRLKKG